MDLDYIFWYNNLAKLIVTGLLPFVSLCVFNFKASPSMPLDSMSIMSKLENAFDRYTER